MLRELTEDSWTTKAEAAVGFSLVQHTATITRTESRSDDGVNAAARDHSLVSQWCHKNQSEEKNLRRHKNKLMKICVRRRIVQKVGSSSVVDLYFTVNSDGRAVVPSLRGILKNVRVVHGEG